MYIHPAHAAPRTPIVLRSGVTASAVALVLAGFAAPAAAHPTDEGAAPPVAEEDAPVEPKNQAGSVEAEDDAAESGEAQDADPVLYEVVAGDYLAAIASANGLDPHDGWKRLFDANPDIQNPDIIVVGQVLRIPGPDEELEPRPLPAAPAPAPSPEPAPEASTAPEPSSTEGSIAPEQSTPQPEPAPVTEPQVNTSAPAGVWEQLAQCESGGNWQANTGNGYYGGLQFTQSSWQAVGGSGMPHEASAGEQIQRAQQLQAIQGWGAWPACSSKLGLR